MYVCLKNACFIFYMFVFFQRKNTMFYFLRCNNNQHLNVETLFINNRNPVDFIQQFVKNVLSFSSQYGGSYSISYAAENIIGPPRKFPKYGDFPQTFAMVWSSMFYDVLF